jgi:Flagellar FliJ protein
MSARRSPLHTVLRVAALRENAARGEVARANARHSAAVTNAANMHARISSPQAAADGQALAAQLITMMRVAEATAEADSAVAGAVTGRQEALNAWATAAGKRSAMEDLLGRHLAEVDREQIAVQQRAMDDRGQPGREPR